MECPKCGGNMEQVRYGANDRVINRCEECGGLWFKPIDLTRLRRTFKAEYLDIGSSKVGKQQNKVEDIECPVCGMKCDKVSDDEQKHIWYESCPNGHGVYFDAGELTDLSQETLSDKIKGWITGAR